MRQRAAASLLYQSKYAEAAFRNLLKLIFLKIVGRILAFYTIIISLQILNGFQIAEASIVIQIFQCLIIFIDFITISKYYILWFV